MEFLSQLQNGFGASDAALLLNRTALGTFFAISGYHKLFNPHRHAVLVDTFKKLGIPAVGFNQWWVPGVEFFAGLALISGILAPFAAMGLAVICLVATCTAGLKRIDQYEPIDKADWLDDLLYLPETLYLIGLGMVMAFGPGEYTLVNAIMEVM